MLSLSFHGLSMGVHDDQCGSDHSPIFLKLKNLTREETESKWQIPKADWIKSNKLCSTLINKEIINKPYPMSTFTKTLIKIAKQTILKSSTKPHSKTNPWFKVECREAVKTKKKCSNISNITFPETISKNTNKLEQKLVISLKKLKKETRRNYISKLNNKTPNK